MPRKKKFDKRILTVFLGIVFILVGMYTFFGSNGLMEIIRRKSIEKNISDQLEIIKSENLALRAKIWSLNSRLFDVERIAREELLLIKPGERVYIVKEIAE